MAPFHARCRSQYEAEWRVWKENPESRLNNERNIVFVIKKGREKKRTVDLTEDDLVDVERFEGCKKLNSKTVSEALRHAGDEALHLHTGRRDLGFVESDAIRQFLRTPSYTDVTKEPVSPEEMAARLEQGESHSRFRAEPP